MCVGESCWKLNLQGLVKAGMAFRLVLTDTNLQPPNRSSTKCGGKTKNQTKWEGVGVLREDYYCSSFWGNPSSTVYSEWLLPQ